MYRVSADRKTWTVKFAPGEYVVPDKVQIVPVVPDNSGCVLGKLLANPPANVTVVFDPKYS